jgi:AraC-like DNA-binding protein
MNKHFRVPARLPAKLKESGVRLAAVLRSAGLSPSLFDQPRILVTTDELFAFWRAVGEVSPDPTIGLQLGVESKPEHFDPIALAALSTGNFGEAMRQMSRYKQLTCPEEIIHESDTEEWSIQFRWLRAQEHEPDVLTDLCFAYVLSVARHGTGTRMSPLRLELVRPRTYAKALQRHFGCPVIFGTSRNALVFRAPDADRPFVTQNAELLAMLAPQLDEELKQHKGQESFPERVRATIQKKLAGRRPKMHDIARELYISPRTLQRRLQDAGYSFQQILEEARRQLAHHYLTSSLLELNETAYLLGYEDSGSFIRAFRSWEGVPPAHWRGVQRAKVAS